MREYCPFHASEALAGVRLADGSYDFECHERGHPAAGPWRWLVVPHPLGMPDISRIADDLGLAIALPAAVASLGDGWFEYGLVERAYALAAPKDFATMVHRWSHTAIAPKQYTVSSFLAGVLGRLASRGEVAYHPGPGTGRWSYNRSISYWSHTRDADWAARTTWADVVGDDAKDAQLADAACRAYVHGA
jgi:hypothetical protein